MTAALSRVRARLHPTERNPMKTEYEATMNNEAQKRADYLAAIGHALPEDDQVGQIDLVHGDGTHALYVRADQYNELSDRLDVSEATNLRLKIALGIVTLYSVALAWTVFA